MTRKSFLSLTAVVALTLTGCGGGGGSSSSSNGSNTQGGNQNATNPRAGVAECTTYTTPTNTTLSGNINTCTELTKDKVWTLDGLVVVKGTTLKIQPGTKIIGKSGDSSSASYMIVDKDAKIMAEGTESEPIIFTSKIAYDGGGDAVGQWGGLTIIGNDINDQVKAYEVNSLYGPQPGKKEFRNPNDNSGVLKHVKILNTGVPVAPDKEINGLSLIAVGSGTTIEDITVEKSDDDCVEIWGGSVNLTNVTVRECTDDQFDIDDGYSGTVTNLDIHQTATNSGNAGIEMSGKTAATFKNLTIVQDASNKEGGIYFKKDGIGGHFENATITDNSNNGAGAIHSRGKFDANNTSFKNVTLNGSSADDRFTNDSDKGGSATEIEVIFDAGTGNTKN